MLFRYFLCGKGRHKEQEFMLLLCYRNVNKESNNYKTYTVRFI